MGSLYNLPVAVLGGDERELEVVRFLADSGADVRVCGRDDVKGLKVRLTSLKDAFEGAKVVIGPVRGIEQNGAVFAKPSVGSIRITSEDLRLTAPGSNLLIGRASNELKEMAKSLKMNLVEYALRDDFAIYNAIPTAEGAVEIALRELPITIHGSNSFVLGFGKVGEALGLLLKAMGSKVTVYNRSPAPRARAYQMGLIPIDESGVSAALNDADIIYNTIPAMILNKDALQNVRPTTPIIDLASEPGGTDFEAAKNLGLRVIHALGLPGKTAPVTAGRIVAKVVDLLIKECCPL